MKKTADVITNNTPPGFMSLRAWYEREGITRSRANEWIQTGRIKYQRIGKRYIVIPQYETVTGIKMREVAR